MLDINAMGSANGIQLTWNDADGSATDYATITVEDTNGKLKLATVDSDGANGHICLMPDGYVGINVSTPAAALDIDGNIKLKIGSLRSKYFVNGDQVSISIAAASIIGKIHRDQYMAKIGKNYPFFNFIWGFIWLFPALTSFWFDL